MTACRIFNLSHYRAKRCAGDIIQKISDEQDSVTLDDVLYELSADLTEADLDRNLQGYYYENVISDDDFCRGITIDYNLSPEKKRFAIAHELGHIAMHSSFFKENPELYEPLRTAPINAQKNRYCVEANIFAAHLLIPDEMLEQKSSLNSIHNLSRIFGVTEELIRYRRRC
jgi:Zn-dependent peptidase ImmA (M78 family)